MSASTEGKVKKNEGHGEGLDKIVKQQLADGVRFETNSHVMALKRRLVANSTQNGTSTVSAPGSFAGIGPIIPIDDLDDPEYDKMPSFEKLIRCKLASVYRLIDLFGWTEYIYNHITIRVSEGDEDEFFINPFGLLYTEITAASLVKVNIDGKLIDPGSTTLGINRAGFVLHSAIHAARRDVRAIIHLHVPAVAAVSVMKCGLLPLCQEACVVGPVSYHKFHGILVDDCEKKSIVEDLGPTNKVMILHNHGVVVCGETLEDALFTLLMVIHACEVQVRYASMGLENLIQISEEAFTKSYQIAQGGAGGVDDRLEEGNKQVKWRRGELEFTALMRLLDNAGYHTGHLYRAPLVRNPKK